MRYPAALLVGLFVVGGCDASTLTGTDPRDQRPAVRHVRVPETAQPARVVDHVDGDTVRLIGTTRGGLLGTDGWTPVRLLEIDTPEVSHSDAADECYGPEASRALRRLLPVGTEVWVSRDRELHDRYGRKLLYLWTQDGRFVNQLMVRRGFAESVLFEPNDRYIEQMREAEAQARGAGRGLWGAC